MTQYTIPAEGLVAKPAHELAAMIQSGEVTSREVTQAFLDRIAEVDGDLGAFLHVGAEEALAALHGRVRLQRNARGAMRIDAELPA